MNILDKILSQKEKEVWIRKKEVPYRHLEKAPFFLRTPLSLRQALASAGSSGIIAEFKRASPSKGIIRKEARAGAVVAAYGQGGAAAVSVLTDTPFFSGSLGDLQEARQHTALPLLRKEFIIDEYQIVEAKASGADAILLIAAVLEKERIRTFTRLAGELHLEVLFEIHTPRELVKMPGEEVLVGVNNRNLSTFEVSLHTALNAAPLIPPDLVAVAESGLRETESIWLLRQAGYRGFLIGETFMKEEDPGKACRNFIHKIKT